MKKIEGGELHYWMTEMAPIRMTKAHWDAIRSGQMAERWFASVVDTGWKLARPAAIERLKMRLRAEAALRLPVVDRRPSKIGLVSDSGGTT